MSQDLDARRQRIRERKRDGGFLTDDEVRGYTGYQWTAADRELVREALAAIPHDEDCNWLPAGGVYIALHRHGQYIVGLHGGTVRVHFDAPDAAQFFTERLGPSYRISNSRTFELFTMPSGGGPQAQGQGSRAPAETETETCPRCNMKRSVSGACLC